MNTYCFGALLEDPSPAIVNRVYIDLFSLKRVNLNAKLTVMTNYPEEFTGFGNVLGFSVIQLPDFSETAIKAMSKEEKKTLQAFSLWKLYYTSNIPIAPPVAADIYKCRVRNPEVLRIKMSKGKPNYPVIDRPNDNRIVPPGTSPNINKIPPRHTHNNWLPVTPF